MHRLLSWPSLCVCACAVCSLRLLKESLKRAAHLYLFRKSRWWREKEWEGERKCSIAQASFIFSRGHTINVSHRDGNSKATREIERKRERTVFPSLSGLQTESGECFDIVLFTGWIGTLAFMLWSWHLVKAFGEQLREWEKNTPLLKLTARTCLIFAHNCCELQPNASVRKL